MAAPRLKDLYGRPAISQSRGRTHERILSLQHAAGALPGADDLIAACGSASIGQAIARFNREWVGSLTITARRAYERSLVLLCRDLAERDTLGDDLGALSANALAAHIDWRIANHLTDPAELQRAAAHMTRLAAWLDEHAGTSIGLERGVLRAHVVAATAATGAAGATGA